MLGAVAAPDAPGRQRAGTRLAGGRSDLGRDPRHPALGYLAPVVAGNRLGRGAPAGRRVRAAGAAARSSRVEALRTWVRTTCVPPGTSTRVCEISRKLRDRLAEIKNDVAALDRVLGSLGYERDLDAAMPRQKREVLFGLANSRAASSTRSGMPQSQ